MKTITTTTAPAYVIYFTTEGSPVLRSQETFGSREEAETAAQEFLTDDTSWEYEVIEYKFAKNVQLVY